jgi:hypothetical protein
MIAQMKDLSFWGNTYPLVSLAYTPNTEYVMTAKMDNTQVMYSFSV